MGLYVAVSSLLTVSAILLHVTVTCYGWKNPEIKIIGLLFHFKIFNFATVSVDEFLD